MKPVYHVYMNLINREAVGNGIVTIVDRLCVSDYNQYAIMIFCLIAYY